MKLWWYGVVALVVVGTGCRQMEGYDAKPPCVAVARLNVVNDPDYSYSGRFVMKLADSPRYVVTAELSGQGILWVSDPLVVQDGKSEFTIDVNEKLPLRISMQNVAGDVLVNFTGKSELLTQEGYYGTGAMRGEGAWLTEPFFFIKFVGRSKDGGKFVINENSPELFTIQFYIRELDGNGIPIAIPQ